MSATTSARFSAATPSVASGTFSEVTVALREEDYFQKLFRVMLFPAVSRTSRTSGMTTSFVSGRLLPAGLDFLQRSCCFPRSRTFRAAVGILSRLSASRVSELAAAQLVRYVNGSLFRSSSPICRFSCVWKSPSRLSKQDD